MKIEVMNIFSMRIISYTIGNGSRWPAKEKEVKTIVDNDNFLKTFFF